MEFAIAELLLSEAKVAGDPKAGLMVRVMVSRGCGDCPPPSYHFRFLFPYGYMIFVSIVTVKSLADGDRAIR